MSRTFVPKTHEDYKRAKRLTNGVYRAREAALPWHDSGRCEACRGRGIACHTSVTYKDPARTHEWRWMADDPALDFTDSDKKSPCWVPVERWKTTSIEKGPRTCEACGGSGMFTRAAREAYFERHPERLCGCWMAYDMPGPHHHHDDAHGDACPLYVTYVRTEEEQLVEQIEAREEAARLERIRSGTEPWHHNDPRASEMVTLEVRFALLQRSADKLMTWLSTDVAIVDLAQRVRRSGKPLDLILAPCSYDPDSLKMVARKLRGCRMMVTEVEGGIRVEPFTEPRLPMPRIVEEPSERAQRLMWGVRDRC